MRDSAALRSVSLAPLAWLALSLFACREDQRSAPLPTPAAAPTMLREGLEDGGRIADGERRRYRSELPAGWFLEIESVQQGADFKLQATGPGLSVEADSPNGRQGPERLLLWAETAGVYEVELAVDRAVPDAEFSLRVVSLHEGSERERRRADAFALGMQADSQRRSGDGTEMRLAIATYKREAAAWRELGEQKGEMHALAGLVIVARELHARKEIIEASRVLATFYERAADPSRQAESLVDLGEALSEQDQRPAAQEALRTALRILAKSPNAESEARAWNALGGSYQMEGKLSQARDAFERSLTLWRQLKRGRSEATARVNLAYLLAELGEPERALDEVERARRAYPGELLPDDEAFLLEREMDTLARLGRFDGSRARADRAIALRRALRDPRALASALSIAAGLEYRMERFARARELYVEAQRSMLEAGDAGAAAVNLLSAGWCQVLEKQWKDAEESFAAALPILERADNLRDAASALAGLAWTARERGDLIQARRHALDALSRIEVLRSSTDRLDFRASLLANRQQFFDLAVDVLMQLGAKTGDERWAAEALAVSERAHGRFLLEALPSLPPVLGGTAGGSNASPVHWENEKGAEQRVLQADTECRRLRAAGGGSEDLRRCESRLRSALDRLRETESVTAAGLAARPVSLAEVQRELLADDAQLLLYDLGRSRSYLWVVSRRTVHAFTLAGAADLERRALDAYRALAASHQRSAWFEARRRTEALAAELLGPALPVLTGRRLLIVREGALLYVPFGALPVPTPTPGDRPPLVARYEVSYLPSASVAVWMRRRQVSPSAADFDVVALAHPLPAAGFSPLPFTVDEAQAVVAASPHRRGKAFVGAAAVKELITESRLGEPRFLHLATHGFADHRYPELSGLVFAARNRQGRRDGLLRAYEVARLRLRCELVVLSACDSGLGAQIAGEGLVGLPHAFLRAGAGKVLASLWPVNDPAAAVLMREVYEGLLRKNQSPEAALQQAQLQLATHPKWRQPYYWAGFVLIGAG